MLHKASHAACLASALVCLTPSAQAQLPAEGTFQTDADGKLVHVFRNQSMQVDPTVISARFAPGTSGLDEFRSKTKAAGLGDFPQLQSLRLNRLGVHDFEVPAGTDVRALVSELHTTGLFQFVELNYLGKYSGDVDDTQFDLQWALKNTGQSGGTPDADMDVDLAWDITSGDSSIVLAVLDSGTLVTHPDLASTRWVNSSEIPGNGQDDDNNGYVDDLVGWDFENDNNNVTSGFFHGTFVAGIAAATANNGKGIAGVAGGSGNGDGCRYMALGVGEFGPSTALLDDAILYAFDNGANVITMSLSVGQTSATDMAIDEAYDGGTFIDCAAGNSGIFGVSYPAVLPKVIAIGSTNRNDQVSSFSSIGPEVFLSAPGEDVWSTDLGDDYTISSGTSFSSPAVAGAAGLLLSISPTLKPATIADILRISSEDLGATGYDTGYGWGRMNVNDALLEVVNNDCNNNGIYDPQELTDNPAADSNSNGIPDDCEPAISYYCSGKSSSAGCFSTLSSSDDFNQPVSGANDFEVFADQVQGLKSGLLFYGFSGPASLPFSGGTLCVQPPNGRTAVQNSGGSDDLACDGQLALLVNTGEGPPTGTDAGAGNTVWLQAWYRDPANGAGTLGTALSNAAEVTFQ